MHNHDNEQNQVQIAMNIEQIKTVEGAKKNLCVAFHSLDGKQKRHAFAPYISSEGLEQIKSYELEKTVRNHVDITIPEGVSIKHLLELDYADGYKYEEIAPEPLPLEDRLKKLLGNDEAANHISALVSQAQKDMARCLSVDPVEVNIDIFTVGRNGNLNETFQQSMLWHIDNAYASHGVRAIMPLVGEPTIFSDDNPDIYKTGKDALYNVRTNALNKTEEPAPGEVAIFSQGEESGAAHSSPLLDKARAIAYH